MIIEEKLDEGLTDHIRKLVSNGNIQSLLMDADKKPTALRAALRTANILICVSHGINSVTEIAEVCKLNKATVHGLLQVLCESRLTMRDPVNHRYHIGQLITEIASNPFVTHENLISCALNEMRRLSGLTNESIGLGILLGLQQITLYEIPSTYDLKIVGKHKIIQNIYAGAAGKVLLSQLSNKDLKIALVNLVLEPLTEYTVTRKDQLIPQLKQIREQGYAVTYGERILEAINLSVPIKNYVVPASISILGPESRVKPRVNEYIKAIIAASDQIEKSLKQIFKLIK